MKCKYFETNEYNGPNHCEIGIVKECSTKGNKDNCETYKAKQFQEEVNELYALQEILIKWAKEGNVTLESFLERWGKDAEEIKKRYRADKEN